MARQTVIFAVSAIILCLIQNSVQLECYECMEYVQIGNSKRMSMNPSSSSSSSTSSSTLSGNAGIRLCGNLTGDVKTICNENEKACLKLVGQSDGSERLITRKCGNADICRNPANGTECYSCTDNKCNGATTMVLGSTVLFFPILLFAKYF